MQEKKKHYGLMLAVKIVLFSTLTILMLNALGDWVYPSETRGAQLSKRLYALEESPDFFVTGSSLCYRSFIPKLFEEESGCSCIQVATSAQSALESLTLLRELVNRGVKPKYAMVYIGPASRFNRVKTEYSVIVEENLRFSLNKLNLIYNTHYDLEELPNVLVKAHRSREYLVFRLQTLLNTRITLQFSTDTDQGLLSLSTQTKTAKVKDYGEVTPYIGDGYENCTVSIPADQVMISEKYNVQEKNSDPTTMSHWQQIADLCKKEGIQLILVATPRIPMSILTANKNVGGDYTDVNDYFKRLAEKYDAILWDLNYLNTDLITYSADQFRDTHHGNNKLAMPLTRILAHMCAELEAGKLVESNYFHNSLETYSQHYTDIQGIWMQKGYSTDKNGVETKKVQIIAGGDTQTEWRASFSDEKDGVYTVGQDWCQDEKVLLNGEVTGRYLKIEARKLGSDVIEQTGITKTHGQTSEYGVTEED